MEEEPSKPGPSNWRERDRSLNRKMKASYWQDNRDRDRSQSNSFRNPQNSTRFQQNEPNRQRTINGSKMVQNLRPPVKACSSGHAVRGGRIQNTRFARDNDRFKLIGFRTLEDIAKSDAKDMLQKINERKEGLMNLANSPIERHDVFVLLIKVFSKISESPFIELKSKLILDVCNSNFIASLRNYLMDLPYVENKSPNNLYWKDQTEFWKNFIIFCGDIVDASPSTALRKCRALIEGISKTCLECLNQRHGFVLSEENALKLENIRNKITTYGDKYQPEEKRKRLEGDTDMQPPENFRELSVVPTRDDLLVSKPFLRPNIVEGGYQDVEHYLDVQFRLLREDCFGPFREGIYQFLADSNKRKYEHVRIFHNVRFVCPYVDNLKVGAIVQIDMASNRNFQKINWSHNKRFLFGSLLLFTKDHCNSFIAATILDRNVNLLSTGKLPVSIIDTHISNRIYNEETYTMIESEVYFEPYYHVLKALQEPTFPQHLAMQQYIVKVEPITKHPAYLHANKKYIISDEKVLHELDLQYQTDSDSEDEAAPEIEDGEIKEIKFKVLQPETWPKKEALNFNESQYEAYRLALTNEFAVIQGPPGTGKTYIGINVAKTLLQNVKSNTSCLMLIICYTNHALDQFLEAISKVTKSIVRIGSQSRNNAMDEFNLTKLRRQAPRSTFFFEEKHILRSSIEDLQDSLTFLDILDNGVVTYNCLPDIPAVQLLTDYYENMNIVHEDPLNYWLFQYRSDYRRHIKDCLADYGTLINNEEYIDEKRTEMVLDDEGPRNEKKNRMDSFIENNATFLLSRAKLEIRRLISIYENSRDPDERYEIELIIQDLDSKINVYNDMEKCRHREVHLNINAKTKFSSISIENRWCLYFMWTRNLFIEVNEKILQLQETVTPALTAYDEARMLMDVELIKEEGVRVLGMTTSGAARMRKLLQAIGPKIVIVEEAAEVLEQHIITSLTSECQHLILIGDHQQLRPSAAHMKLAKQYNIEVSLFERMITNGIHSRRLNVQHRMRPEIAALIAPHIYPDLTNHPSVETFNDVAGIDRNVYFFTHEFKEEDLKDGNSKANHKEADMTLALAHYIMQQGYSPDDLTILAAYSGQMFYMRKERQNYPSLTQVKITVVDNYQGEESKIIILSLVRNNPENSIGFLGTENRICVALSRAKEGFYIFGNINMLKEKSDLWKKISETLESNGSLGRELKLKCQNHPDQITIISCPDDFNKLPPEGGCFEICNYQYECGHQCRLYCHGYDRKHVKTKCSMPCDRVLCDLGHVCPLKCREPCEPCQVLVLKALPCGHNMNVHCCREPEDPVIKCLTVIEVTLPNCGHKAQKCCYLDLNKAKCFERCDYRLEACGHVCGRLCHVTDDPDHENYTCMKACARAKEGCTAELLGDRGEHQCLKKCYEPCDECHVQVLKKRSTCKHVDRVACCKIIDEIPCTKKCARTMPCGHFCKKKCSEVCENCTQMVVKPIPGCDHKVKVKCMTTVTRAQCTEQCKRKLSCGHPCMDRCAAECDPSKCKELVSVEVESPCGHRVKLPCHAAASYAKGELKLEQLAQYCQAECRVTLACGHACGGRCAACQQGRLHLPCRQTCNQDNICGHQCQEPCNQICPPCKMRCEVRCQHSRCKKWCGEPCVPCQEKCGRRCVHGACSRRCGEECSRPPCGHACPRRLECGHACRGLCGEPCPPVCRLCRPDTFPTDFLGYDYDDDDKFVLLQDCGHVLEVETMDSLMLGDQEDIKIRVCPFCRKPIVNTNRYKDAVNKMFKYEINPIKERVYGTKGQIDKKLIELRLKLTEFLPKYVKILNGFRDLNTTYINFENLIRSQKNVSLLQVEMECVYFNIFEIIVECWQKYTTQSPEITTLKDELQKDIKIILNVLKIKAKSKIPIKISVQQQQDISYEIKRLNVIVQFSQILHVANTSKDDPKVSEDIKTAKAAVFTLCKFNEDKALEAIKQLQTTIKSTGVLSKHERELIVQAIGLKAGRWFKCPNGHFYCIGECGGANQVSKCADCGAAIGGTNHTLISDNSHAPEMDGSKFPAWSEQNNVANFNIL